MPGDGREEEHQSILDLDVCMEERFGEIETHTHTHKHSVSLCASSIVFCHFLRSVGVTFDISLGPRDRGLRFQKRCTKGQAFEQQEAPACSDSW